MIEATPTEIRKVLANDALNGERPAWSIARQSLIWVDIRGPNLHEFKPESGEDRLWEMPSWVGCHALTTRGAVVALRTGLYHFEFEAERLTALAPAPFDQRRFIFNDGRCDRRGRFFAGTMFAPLVPAPELSDDERATPLRRYDGHGRWSEVTAPVSTSNGLAWSPDGTRMYHGDSKEKLIWCYDYDQESATPSNPRVFADVTWSEGAPDGAVVDAEGFYWCAVFGGGEILRYDPAGGLERRIEVPSRFPTMPVLGGDDLRTMFVTSASWKLPPHLRGHTPDGSLFAFEAPCAGLPSCMFDEAMLAI